MPRTALYSIGAVARMVGVSVSTLRTWEERYGVVVATRSAGGQRRYSRDQVEQLSFIVKEVERGMSPGDAHRLLAHPAGAVTQQPPDPPDGIGLLILVAERDPHAAGYVDYFLRTEGYRVEVVSDAAEAERRFALLAPQLVVVELLLSGGLGGPLIERLRDSSARVIVISALAAEEISETLGADAFLQKPIDPVALVSTVRDLLGTSALTRAPARSRA